MNLYRIRLIDTAGNSFIYHVYADNERSVADGARIIHFGIFGGNYKVIEVEEEF